jgi:hypothetical protein
VPLGLGVEPQDQIGGPDLGPVRVDQPAIGGNPESARRRRSVHDRVIASDRSRPGMREPDLKPGLGGRAEQQVEPLAGGRQQRRACERPGRGEEGARRRRHLAEEVEVRTE